MAFIMTFAENNLRTGKLYQMFLEPVVADELTLTADDLDTSKAVDLASVDVAVQVGPYRPRSSLL
jgi:hypothetical protein